MKALKTEKLVRSTVLLMFLKSLEQLHIRMEKNSCTDHGLEGTQTTEELV